MTDDERERQIRRIMTAVRDALLTRGAGSSIGGLVADIEGDGTTPETDPHHVWDRHFFRDVADVDGWRDEPRDPDEVNELVDAVEEYWLQYPDKRFCQLVCRIHTRQNGLADFDPEGTAYAKPLDELTDEQVLDFIEEYTDDE